MATDLNPTTSLQRDAWAVVIVCLFYYVVLFGFWLAGIEGELVAVFGGLVFLPMATAMVVLSDYEFR